MIIYCSHSIKHVLAVGKLFFLLLFLYILSECLALCVEYECIRVCVQIVYEIRLMTDLY